MSPKHLHIVYTTGNTHILKIDTSSKILYTQISYEQYIGNNIHIMCSTPPRFNSLRLFTFADW